MTLSTTAPHLVIDLLLSAASFKLESAEQVLRFLSLHPTTPRPRSWGAVIDEVI